MLNYEKDGCLVVELDSRMDAANSDSAEAEIREAVRQHPGFPLCLDALKRIVLLKKLRFEVLYGSRYSPEYSRAIRDEVPSSFQEGGAE